jgi:hypothetical protein
MLTVEFHDIRIHFGGLARSNEQIHDAMLRSTHPSGYSGFC